MSALRPLEPTLHPQPELRAALMLTGAHTAHVPAGWQYGRHDHPHFELGLLLHGEQHTRLTGRTLVQRPGDLIFLTPFEAHGAMAPADSAFYCLHFDVDDIELRRVLCLMGSRVFGAGDEVLRHVAPVLERMGRADPAAVPALTWRLEVCASLYALFAALAQGPARAPALPQAALQTAERLATLIEREVEQGAETPIEAAIRRLGYTPGHGNTLFRQVYGLSAQQYRSMLKLRRAKLLLLDAALSVGQVSERLGYSSVAHFSRQFRRWAGVSPAGFRQAAPG